MNNNINHELTARGFSYSNGNVFALHSNRIFSYEEFLHEIDNIEKEYQKNIKLCWEEIFKTNQHGLYSGQCTYGIYKLASHVYNRIQRRISNNFYGKNSLKISQEINKVFSCNSICNFNDRKSIIIVNNFSSIIKSEVAMYNLYIIQALIKNEHKNAFSKITKLSNTKGVSGPWSNLDLPMQERVFEWKDVEEETKEREVGKQKQRRYQMGYEDEKDGFKEGYYYRELRNEPYLYENASFESPYPYRSVLWSQP